MPSITHHLRKQHLLLVLPKLGPNVSLNCGPGPKNLGHYFLSMWTAASMTSKNGFLTSTCLLCSKTAWTIENRLIADKNLNWKIRYFSNNTRAATIYFKFLNPLFKIMVWNKNKIVKIMDLPYNYSYYITYHICYYLG